MFWAFLLFSFLLIIIQSFHRAQICSRQCCGMIRFVVLNFNSTWSWNVRKDYPHVKTRKCLWGKDRCQQDNTWQWVSHSHADGSSTFPQKALCVLIFSPHSVHMHWSNQTWNKSDTGKKEFSMKLNDESMGSWEEHKYIYSAVFFLFFF